MTFYGIIRAKDYRLAVGHFLKKGVMRMVTYDMLFQFTLVLISVAALCASLWRKK